MPLSELSLRAMAAVVFQDKRTNSSDLMPLEEQPQSAGSVHLASRRLWSPGSEIAAANSGAYGGVPRRRR